MIEFDCEEVKRQLNRFHDALPDDRVDIWLEVSGGKLRFNAYLAGRDNLPLCSSTRDSVVEAVDDVLKEAGPRDSQAKVRAQRLAIEKARAELAKLESELDPLVAAMDKAKEENPT